MEDIPITIDPRMRYVAFCDVLGFSDAVENRFEHTIAVYAEFMKRMRNWPFPDKAEISIYSDSILIVSDELPPVIHAVKNLWFATLTQDWLIRGGIAYGRYWEKRENGNLFVVSDALVRAVKLESTVSYPAVAFSPEVDLTLAAWVPRYEHGVLPAPVLHFRGLSFVNPFNPYWFQSARMRVSQMLDASPEHAKKYNWFLDLTTAVDNEESLIPEDVLNELLEKASWFTKPVNPVQRQVKVRSNPSFKRTCLRQAAEVKRHPIRCNQGVSTATFASCAAITSA